MSRSGGSRAARVVTVVTVTLLAVLSTPAPAQQPLTPASDGIWLGSSSRQLLRHIQQGWVQWSSAYYQHDRDEVETELALLRELVEQTGFERLPDLALAATARAVDSIRDGDHDRALWALQAAESLDPGRPEISFARARIARAEGSRLGFLGHELAGYWRLGAVPRIRVLWLHGLAQLALVAVLLAGTLFIVLMAATKGHGVVAALRKRLGDRLPRAAQIALTVFVLAWPLLLPMGILCLVLYWSVLVWGRCSTSERVVLISLWVVAAATPAVLALQQDAVAATLSPPVQAYDGVAEQRLYGALFNDLEVTVETLGQHPLVTELRADVHRMLGQWDRASALYRDVLEAEPANYTALLNLGAYYFRKGDHGNAVAYFERATEIAPDNAAAFFNLSQAYSDAYLFDEQQRALVEARRLDGDAVRRWIQRSERERIVTASGSTQRRAEFETLVRREWPTPGRAQFPLLAGIGAAVVTGLWLTSLAVGRLVRPPREALAPPPEVVSWRYRLPRIVVPGYRTAESRAGGRCFMAMLSFSLILVVFARHDIGYRIPWGIDPATTLPVVVALAALAVLYAARAVIDWQVHRL